MSLAIMTYLFKGRHGHNYMAVIFTTACAISAYDITTKVVRSNPTHGKVYSIQHYVIKFFCDLQQVGCFFPGTPVSFINKTDHHYTAEILLKVALSTITLTLILLFMLIC